MKLFLLSLGFLLVSTFTLNVYAEEDISTGGVAPTGGLGFGGGNNADVDAAESGNFGQNPASTPAAGGGGGGKGGKSGKGGNEVPEAIKSFVAPTSSFGMGGLCVGSSCGLELGTGTPNDVIWRGIRVIASVAGTVAILFYIVGAFFLITAQDENGLTKGKTVVIYTSLGLVLIFGAYIIVQFVLALIFAT